MSLTAKEINSNLDLIEIVLRGYLPSMARTNAQCALAALRSLESAPAQEPVAWMYQDADAEQGTGISLDPPYTELAQATWIPLYTAPQPQAAGEELARLREIEHRVWHLLDASCEDSVGTELTIDLEVAGDDYQKLLDLMPEAHPAAPSSPAAANESPVDSHSSGADARIVKYLLDQAAHIEDNASKLKTFAGSEDEARCRELCASYLRELAALVIMESEQIGWGAKPADASISQKGTAK